MRGQTPLSDHHVVNAFGHAVEAFWLPLVFVPRHLVQDGAVLRVRRFFELLEGPEGEQFLGAEAVGPGQLGAEREGRTVGFLPVRVLGLGGLDHVDLGRRVHPGFLGQAAGRDVGCRLRQIPAFYSG